MVLLKSAFEPLNFEIIFLKTAILKLFMFQTSFTFDTLDIGDNYVHELPKLKIILYFSSCCVHVGQD